MKLSKYFLPAIAAISLLASSVALAKPVNINTASADEISESLSGIGPSTADAIVDYRKQNGAFDSLDDLLAIKGIGPSTLNKIGSEVLFGNADASNLDNLLNTNATNNNSGAINLNTASVDELATLNGIGASTAAKIISHRETYGPFNSVDELANVSGIGASTVEKNRTLITVNASNNSQNNGLLGDLFGNDSATTPAVETGGLIDINTADAATLSAGMVGVGDSTAAAIVAYRQANGSFASVDELANVKGIGAATIAKNSGLITAGSANNSADTNGNLLDNIFGGEAAANNVAQAGAVNLNTASAEELAAGLDGVGASTAAKIVAYRKANGNFASVEELGNVSGIGPATVAANLDRMTVSAPAAIQNNTTAANTTGVVNINTASAEELASALSGIGTATAKKIVAYRQANGDFTAVEELGNVSGIGPATVAANLDNMIVGIPVGKAANIELTAPLNINTASLEELQALTYIGPVKAQRIIEYRQTQGRIDSMEELMSIKGIGDKTIEKNSQWIRF